MTIKELIELLQQYPKDTDVTIKKSIIEDDKEPELLKEILTLNISTDCKTGTIGARSFKEIIEKMSESRIVWEFCFK